MHGFLYLYILYSPALSKSSAGFCLPYLFSLFLRSYLITSPPDSPSFSPALPHPGLVCPATFCSVFSPAEPLPAPPGRYFCSFLFPIFFLFPLRFLTNFSRTSTLNFRTNNTGYFYSALLSFFIAFYYCTYPYIAFDLQSSLFSSLNNPLIFTDLPTLIRTSFLKS